MKSLILYATTKQPVKSSTGDDMHYRMVMPYPPQEQHPVWIRVQVFRGDIDRALLAARPRVGETVLNTVPV